MDTESDRGPWVDVAPGLPMLALVGPGARSGWVYTEALGSSIAELYGESPTGGLAGMRAFNPDNIPPPAIVNAWRRQFPAFGIMMREAERVRAEMLIEQTIVIADTGIGREARLALQIATRQHLAGKLDVSRYGKGDAAGVPAALGHDAQPVAFELDDATLASIAASGRDAPE